jgi:branched-chain amino acid transport system substrate-binding protein
MTHPSRTIGRRKVLKTAVALAGAPFLFNSAHAQNQTIKIGFPSAVTGAFSVEVSDQIKAAQLAVKQFNDAGGLNGRRAELLVRDDRLSVDQAAQVTLELIEKDKVNFVVGSLSAATQIAINKVCKQKEILFNSISQSDMINEAREWSPYTFHEALNPHMTAGAVGRYAFKKFGKKVAYITADYSYGHEMTRAFQRVGQEFGVTTVGEFRYPLGATDFSASLKKIKDLKPDILVLASFGRDLLNAAKQCTEFGIKLDSKVITPILLYTARQQGGVDIFDGILGGSSYYWSLEDRIPSAKAFNDLFRAAYGGAYPSDYGALGYAGVRSVLEATKIAQTTETKQIIAAMAALKYDWYKGPEFYRDCDHQAVQSVLIVESKSKNIRNKYDVFNILEVDTITADRLRTCAELGFKT